MTGLLLIGAAFAAEAPGVFQGVGTPWTVGRGHGTVGLFRPLHIGLGEATDLRVHTQAIIGVLGLGGGLTHRVWEQDKLALAVEGDLSFPTVGLGMARGTLFPSTAEIPAALVARVAVLGGWRSESLVLTVGPLLRAALPFGDVVLDTPDFFWLDGMVAPLTEGPQVGARAQVDWLAHEDWLLQARGSSSFGAVGPDHHARLWGQWGGLGRFTLAAGAAFAWERDTQGPAFFWLPVGDVQVRW